MVRPLTFRLGTAGAIVVFMTMAGFTGVEVHPLSHLGPHSADLIAMELGAAQHGSGGGAHAGHSQHGSSDRCTCVGVCQSTGTPTSAAALQARVMSDEIGYVPVVRANILPLGTKPTAHLLPLPNAPPARA